MYPLAVIVFTSCNE